MHPKSPIPLRTGEPSIFTICSAQRWCWTGLALERGATYRFEVAGEQTWKDASIVTGPDGYTLSRLRIFECLRRVPRAPWFTLIGTIDRQMNTAWVIGKFYEGPSPTTGELICFANDVSLMYWNNTGSLQLTVTKLTNAHGDADPVI